MLTKVPPSWSTKRHKVHLEFLCMIGETRKLVHTREVMELPEEKHGKNISKETEELIKFFIVMMNLVIRCLGKRLCKC